MPAVVRPRVDADLPALVEALARVHLADGYPVHRRHVSAEWLTPDGLVAAWTAEVDGRPVGHAVLESDGAALLVARLFVDTGARGLGLADLLLDVAETAAGPADLTLEVAVRATAAVTRYERRGWTRVDEHDAPWTEVDGTPARAYRYRAPARPPAAGG